MLRQCAWTPATPVWVTIGAWVDSASASKKPLRLMCARSTTTPQRFISRTTSRPIGVSPRLPSAPLPLAGAPSALALKCRSPIARTPRFAKYSTLAGSASSAWPPSMPPIAAS